MAQCVVATRPVGIAVIGRRCYLLRHAFGAQKCVEVSVLTIDTAMRMVKILTVGFAVVHIAFRVVIEFNELPLIF